MHRGRVALENALEWLDIAIAQENLYAGDLVIPAFYDILKTGGKVDSVSADMRSADCSWADPVPSSDTAGDQAGTVLSCL